MLKTSILLLLLLSGLSAAANPASGAKKPQTAQPVATTVEAPDFNADNSTALVHWVLQCLTFDEDDYSGGDTGTVFVFFKIDKGGRLKNLELKYGSRSDLSKKVLDLLTSVPKWRPKQENGKAVDYVQSMLFDMLLVKGDDGKLRAVDHRIYDRVDRMPSFMGGGASYFRDWIGYQISPLINEDFLACRVALEFVVETDGSLSNVSLGEAPPDQVLAALQDVLPRVPRFTPAQIVGADVRFKTRVYFYLDPNAGKSDDVQAGVWNPESKTFVQPETMPLFDGGGLKYFREWVSTKVVFPTEALNRGISGCVKVSFIIDTDGSLTNVQILSTPDRLLSQAVRTVLARSPKWVPGTQRGKPVRVSYTLPVEFREMNGGFAAPSPFSRQNTMRNPLDF